VLAQKLPLEAGRTTESGGCCCLPRQTQGNLPHPTRPIHLGSLLPGFGKDRI